jgi:hypothetical protein
MIKAFQYACKVIGLDVEMLKEKTKLPNITTSNDYEVGFSENWIYYV